MKNLLLFILALISTTTLLSQDNLKNQFTLKGKVIGQKTGYVHIAYFNDQKKYINDSCFLQNGKFQFTGWIKEPIRATFYGKRKSRRVDDPNWTEIFLEPGNITAIFQVDEFKKAQITGSKSQNDFSIFNNRIDSLNQ